MPGGFHQVVEADDHAERQANNESPRRGGAPVINRVTDPPKYENSADQRVAGAGSRAGRGCVLLQGPRRSRIRKIAVLLGHSGANSSVSTARQYSPPCEMVHAA